MCSIAVLLVMMMIAPRWTGPTRPLRRRSVSPSPGPPSVPRLTGHSRHNEGHDSAWRELVIRHASGSGAVRVHAARLLPAARVRTVPLAIATACGTGARGPGRRSSHTSDCAHSLRMISRFPKQVNAAPGLSTGMGVAVWLIFVF